MPTYSESTYFSAGGKTVFFMRFIRVPSMTVQEHNKLAQSRQGFFAKFADGLLALVLSVYSLPLLPYFSETIELSFTP